MDIIANTPAPPEPLNEQQVRAWMDYVTEPLARRRDDEIIPALIEMLEAHPKIADGDEETAEVFTENISMAVKLQSAAKREHDTQKRPYIDGGNVVTSWLKRFNTVLDRPLAQAKNALIDYGLNKAARAKAEAEERARATAEAATQASIAAGQALKRNPLGEQATALLEEAAQAVDVAAKAEAAMRAKPAEASRTVGVYGATSTVRTTWWYELEDFDAVPLEFKMVNDDAVKLAMKDRDPISGRPRREIPGLRWIEQHSLQVRR